MHKLVAFSNRYLFNSDFGEKMGMKFHTDVMGDVTTNIGVITYDNENAGLFGINLRYQKDLNLKKLWIVLQMRFNNMALK